MTLYQHGVYCCPPKAFRNSTAFALRSIEPQFGAKAMNQHCFRACEEIVNTESVIDKPNNDNWMIDVLLCVLR